jgi:PAS domain S-box-containing protein
VFLLPSGKLPRIVLGVAGLVAGLLFLDLKLVHNVVESQFFSNSLDLAMVVLAAICAFSIARHSSGYASQLWALLGFGLTLEAIAQAISTYYQAFVPGYMRLPLPSDILFFVWTVPVFMMFLPASDEKSPRWDWIRTLDVTQIIIVASTAYLYFFYVPSRWQANAMDLPRQILICYLIRDAFLSLGFLFRSRISVSPALRSFSFGLFFVFLAVALTDGDYLVMLKSFTGGASWGDLLYLVPYFLIVVIAVRWKYSQPDSIADPPSRVADFTSTHVLPLCIPLLVIVMGRSIAKDQVILAWLAVSASFLCAALRLILTNRKQARISKELLDTEKALHRSEKLFASAFRASPDAFSITLFPDGPFIDVNEGFLQLTGYPREEILDKTPIQMNLWRHPDHRNLVMTRLAQHGEIREEEFVFQTKSGQTRTGLLSGALFDLDGRRCALMLVRDITDRKVAEELLRSSEERFRTLVRDLHVGIVLHAPDGSIEFANQTALNMFGMSESEVLGRQVTQLGLIALSELEIETPSEDLPISVVIRTKQPVEKGAMGWIRPGVPEILWIFGNAVPQLNSDGSILRVISAFTDITEMKNAEKAIHKLSTQLLRLQDDERRHIGRELHDGMAQTVLAVNLSLAQVRQSATELGETAERSLDKARELLMQMSREIRTLSYLLHPPLLDDLGLVSALKEYVQGFSERSGIPTSFNINSSLARFPQGVETAFFRIVQESLTNIQRHSGSQRAEISFNENSASISLEIVDFGRGMVLPQDGARRDNHSRLGVGIPGMQERMAQLGGRLDIFSDSSGTTVRATIQRSARVFGETQDDIPSHSHRG